MCFNVLTDTFDADAPLSFRPHLLCHVQRYRATLDELARLQPDVIGLAGLLEIEGKKLGHSG